MSESFNKPEQQNEFEVEVVHTTLSLSDEELSNLQAAAEKEKEIVRRMKVLIEAAKHLDEIEPMGAEDSLAEISQAIPENQIALQDNSYLFSVKGKFDSNHSALSNGNITALYLDHNSTIALMIGDGEPHPDFPGERLSEYALILDYSKLEQEVDVHIVKSKSNFRPENYIYTEVVEKLVEQLRKNT